MTKKELLALLDGMHDELDIHILHYDFDQYMFPYEYTEGIHSYALGYLDDNGEFVEIDMTIENRLPEILLLSS